jgi:2-polyprenyl-3-methyl-5-hydroxy-6-metoxy-1,4-benzoquinol methylase
VHARSSFHECTGCGYAILQAARDRPDYWTSSGEAGAEHFWVTAKANYFRSALDLFASLSGGRRIIDIGGGVGFFTELALGHGWDAYSLDISPTATALAAERVGNERAWPTLDEAADHTFDIACLWCVVAHTVEPSELLKLAARALRPGAHVWITTPNFAYQKRYALVRAVLGNPIDFEAEDHLGQFTTQALATLLRREGFRDPTVHFRGIVESCIVANSDNRLLISAKRIWNSAAFAATRLRLPNLMSELQMTAQAPKATEIR